MGTIVGAEVFVLFCWACNGLPWFPYAATGLVMISFLVCVSMVLTLIWDETGEQALALRDKRLVGTLLELLELVNLGTTVRTALLQHLPSLQPEDANLLNAVQYIRLNQVLLGNDAPLIVAGLQALEQVGGEQSLPFVQRLTVPGRQGPGNAQVREAAQRCLSRLQERIARKDADRTLLRPAQAAPMPDGTLLRAAHSSPPVNAGELLRAGTIRQN